MIESALKYRKAGFQVVPLSGKVPPKGFPLSECLDGRREIDQDWFQREGVDSVGVVCGAPSGNLEVIDFDCQNAFQAFGRQFSDDMRFSMRRGIRITSKGAHLYYRCPEIGGNQVLARDAAGKAIIEIRGQGGYVAAVPSPGKTVLHPSGDITGLFHLDIDTGILKPDERAELFRVARSLNRGKVSRSKRKANGGQMEDDRWNELVDVPELLRRFGWTPTGSDGRWTRPGKLAGISASWNGETFYVFSSNAEPLEPGRGYRAFNLYRMLVHGGDRVEAASALCTRLVKAIADTLAEDGEVWFQDVADNLPALLYERRRSLSSWLKKAGYPKKINPRENRGRWRKDGRYQTVYSKC